MTSAPRALSRGLELLQLVNAAPTGCAFVELRATLGLPNATLSRLLAALDELGYLEHDGARYRPGPGLRAFAAREPLADRLRRLAAPHLEELRERSANTCLLLQWTGGRALCLERLLHEESLVLQAPGHVTRNLFDTPYGVFFLTPARWEAAFRRRARPPGANRQRYRQELARLRRDGFCCGHSADRRRIAAPIRHGETVVGALAIGGTHAGLDDRRIASLGPDLVAAAEACGAGLG